ncbi:hypothetical protein JTB14_016123 [Gonioctena quinquepunctata]|nr:hypothetical protein JTB14_016123 [Gonioctena quinquepunctata]
MSPVLRKINLYKPITSMKAISLLLLVNTALSAHTCQTRRGAVVYKRSLHDVCETDREQNTNVTVFIQGHDYRQYTSQGLVYEVYRGSWTSQTYFHWKPRVYHNRGACSTAVRQVEL